MATESKRTALGVNCLLTRNLQEVSDFSEKPSW